MTNKKDDWKGVFTFMQVLAMIGASIFWANIVQDYYHNINVTFLGMCGWTFLIFGFMRQRFGIKE